MFNKAINEGVLSKEYYPFKKGKYVLPASRNIKKALTLDEVRKIFEYKTFDYSAEDLAKDLWIFSYLSNGMNAKDIALLKESNVDGDFLVFIRAKTARSNRNDLKPISVFLTDYAKGIIQKWKGLCSGEYLFPILTPELTPEKERKTILQKVKQTNKYMKRIFKSFRN
jgi:integrase